MMPKRCRSGIELGRKICEGTASPRWRKNTSRSRGRSSANGGSSSRRNSAGRPAASNRHRERRPVSSACECFFNLGKSPGTDGGRRFYVLRHFQAHGRARPLSARASSVDGISRPRAFAVVMFMMRSNLVGCSTGMSPGFVPRRNPVHIFSGTAEKGPGSLAHTTLRRTPECQTAWYQGGPARNSTRVWNVRRCERDRPAPAISCGRRRPRV